MPRLGIRIMLGIPTLGSSRRSIHWIDALAGLQFPLGSSMGRHWVQDLPIADARNQLCQAALDAGVEYLVMLGDDVLPPQNMILLMLDKIDREFSEGRCDLVTGVYWTKSFPSEPYLWNGLLEGSYRDWTAGEFFPVDLAGCDALMIPTRVLRALEPPYFSTDWVWEPGQQWSAITTEDFYFFTKARKAGFRLWADTSIQCLHEDRQTGYHFGLTVDMPQAGGVPETPDGEELIVAEVGAGYWAPHYGDKTTVVRFDMRPEVKPDVRCDVTQIPELYMGKFDVVHASHVLEHFPRNDAPAIVRHWAGLLKPGGELRIRVPNIAHAFRAILDAEENPGQGLAGVYDWQQIYGGQWEAGPAHTHYNGFTLHKLKNLLERCPILGDVEVVPTNEGDVAGLNLLATARLTGRPDREALVPMWDEIREQGREYVVADDALAAPEPRDVKIVDAHGELAENGTRPEPIDEYLGVR